VINSIVSYFTLRYVATHFTDVVSGKTVCLYVDRYGDRWLKDSRWSFFRLKATPPYTELNKERLR